jgi:hypothetical protein
MPAKAVVHISGDGKAYWMLGGLYEVLLPSDDPTAPRRSRR